MRKNIVKLIREKVEIIYCDKCKKRTKTIDSCYCCDKEFCVNCSNTELTHNLKIDGGHPRICKDCWLRVEPFVKEFQANSQRRDELFDLILKRPKKPKPDSEDPLCKKCGHKMCVHIDEGDGLRCHSILTEDFFQCECKLKSKPDSGKREAG